MPAATGHGKNRSQERNGAVSQRVECVVVFPVGLSTNFCFQQHLNNKGIAMKSSVLSTVFGVASLTVCANPQVTPEIQWNPARAQAETAGFLKDLIRLDTRNPPGNESRVAHYLGEIFAREGIPYEFLEIEPGRASIVARFKGDDTKRPLLILGHEDVVPVEQAKWTVDPFAGLERDGVIYGRGAFDDKAMVAANLEVMLELKRRALPLARDVIFLAEAGEETGGSGMAQLVERFWSKIDNEFALNDGEPQTRGTNNDDGQSVDDPKSKTTASHGSRPRTGDLP
jgi:acetylornithine deacetylase/succinyl-diaminopimelate desuccinylase-like protein